MASPVRERFRLHDLVATLVARLWARGAAGDARAVALVLAVAPPIPTPPFLAAPAGIRLHPWLPRSRAGEAAAMVQGEYWNEGVPFSALVESHVRATAWVGATDARGALVGTARAISDAAKSAWIYDVCVAESHRGLGLGKRLVELLLDHPDVRRARTVRLGTKDAQSLYARYGFTPVSERPPRPWTSTEMVLTRMPH